MRRHYALIAIVVLVGPGCRNYTNNASHWTSIDLMKMGGSFRRFSFDECQRAQALSDMLKTAMERKIITEVVREQMERDAFGRPYVFQRTVADDRIVIRIISVGQNGVFEDGNGDDLVCELTVPKDGNATYKVTYDGRTLSD